VADFRGSPSAPPVAEAQAFIEASDFVWHQRFELAPGVTTPGSHDIGYLIDASKLPEDLRGKTVLDIGTANGGSAFILEKRGAEKVVAMDIYPPDWFGFAALRDFLDSRVEYVQGTVYELTRLLSGTSFDVVLFFGVLYHLRHPLLALDEVRAALSTDGIAAIESAVCDDKIGGLPFEPFARFYRGDELANDPSNWFVPTVACLSDWCSSAGLAPLRPHVWGEAQMQRCLLTAHRTKGPPEFLQLSYEVPLRVQQVVVSPPEL
jgi:tRNA (mo5U34)-methyltransferase